MTKTEFRQLLEEGREAYFNADKISHKIFEKLYTDFESKADIALEDIASDAPNADNLLKAICCFMQYGEYNIDSIWNELIAAYDIK